MIVTITTKIQQDIKNAETYFFVQQWMKQTYNIWAMLISHFS